MTTGATSIEEVTELCKAQGSEDLYEQLEETQENDGNLREMLETGSCECIIGEKKFLLSMEIREITQ